MAYGPLGLWLFTYGLSGEKEGEVVRRRLRHRTGKPVPSPSCQGVKQEVCTPHVVGEQPSDHVFTFNFLYS